MPLAYFYIKSIVLFFFRTLHPQKPILPPVSLPYPPHLSIPLSSKYYGAIHRDNHLTNASLCVILGLCPRQMGPHVQMGCTSPSDKLTDRHHVAPTTGANNAINATIKIQKQLLQHSRLQQRHRQAPCPVRPHDLQGLRRRASPYPATIMDCATRVRKGRLPVRHTDSSAYDPVPDQPKATERINMEKSK